MINPQELIFCVDEYNNPIEPAERSRAHLEGIWHRTTDIAVVNANNEILCHKRSLKKDTGPGKWDVCFGGHTLAGVDSQAAAALELYEESGLLVSPEDLIYVTTIQHINKTGNNKEYRYLYVYRWSGDIQELALEKDEVDEVKWVTIDEISSNRDNDKIWSAMPYIEHLMRVLKS